MTTFEKVRGLLVEKMQLEPDEVKLESRLVEDLRCDSANVMVLIIDMEEEFNLEVADEAVINFKTVQDVVDYIDKAE